MNYLHYKDLNSIFSHREGIDPENYSVAKIQYEGKSTIVVLNTITNEIMDYYYDDIKSDYFDLSIISKDMIGYKINRKSGEVIGIRGNVLTKLYDTWGYPSVKIRGKHPKLHILLSKMFIPNLDLKNNTVVDHIDRDKNNCSLSNLRWVSSKENASNKNTVSWTGDHKYYAYLDQGLTNLAFSLTDEELFNKNLGSRYKGSIRNSINRSCRFDGYYWKIEDLDLINYLNQFNLISIDEKLWKLHYSGKFYVHPLGLIKSKNVITVGSLRSAKSSNHPERSFRTKYRIHVLVAETFLNGNKKLEKGLVIDHINTNSLDNRVENLRICSQKENMNNPNTLEKLSKKVIDPNGKVFKSVSECADEYGCVPTTIINWIRNPNKNFNYYQP